MNMWREYVQGEEGKDVSPDASRLSSGVVTEGLERGQNNENSRPAVVERERKVDEHLVRSALGLVVLLDDIVNMLCGAVKVRWSNFRRRSAREYKARTVTAELTKSAKKNAAERSN